MMHSGGHIILAEDEALSAMFLELTLQRQGYTVTSVASGEHAIRIFKEKGADMLLLDIHLAGELTGLDVARDILKKASIPAIFMTGYSIESLKKELDTLPATAILSKPIEIKRLLAMLNNPA